MNQLELIMHQLQYPEFYGNKERIVNVTKTIQYRPTFDGITYDHRLDRARLTGQLLRVFGAMLGGKWWTLEELRGACGGTTQSCSARVRDLRKPRFGAYTVERRRRTAGTWEYRMVA